VTLHAREGDLTGLVVELLRDAGFQVPFEAVGRDAALVAERIATAGEGPVRGIEMLRPVFFRGKAAHLVGRVLRDGAAHPLVLGVRNRPAGLHVDAVLLDEADLSMLFGFTRSYFFVDTARPYDVVGFLHGLLPKKRLGELYIAIGETKQGKTELYR